MGEILVCEIAVAVAVLVDAVAEEFIAEEADVLPIHSLMIAPYFRTAYVAVAVEYRLVRAIDDIIAVIAIIILIIVYVIADEYSFALVAVAVVVVVVVLTSFIIVVAVVGRL